jgi:hypothetical protein
MHRPLMACNKNHGYECDPVVLVNCQLALPVTENGLHACLGRLALRKGDGEGEGQSEQSDMCQFQPLTFVLSPCQGERRDRGK